MTPKTPNMRRPKSVSPKQAIVTPNSPMAMSEAEAASAVAGGAVTSPGSGGPGEALPDDAAAHPQPDASEEVEFPLLSFDLTRAPTEDEWQAFERLLRHLRAHSVAIRPPSDSERTAYALLAAQDPALAILDLGQGGATASPSSPAGDMGSIRIRAKSEGYRRGGRAHGREWTAYPLDTFSPAQVEAFEADPNLTVELS